MDLAQKLLELKNEIGNLSSEEQSIKNRIQELKFLIEEKKKHDSQIVTLKAEEAALMRELGFN